MVLALAFDTETPFSKIRAQTVKLARALASPPNSVIELQTQDLNKSGQVAPDATTISNFNAGPLISELPQPDPDSVMDIQSTRSENRIGSSKFPKNLNPINIASQTNSHSDLAQKSRKQAGKSLFTQRSEEPLKVEDLRPISPAMHYVNFACLLLPRFPEHHLIGELASSLAKWLGQLCLSYGWRLEHQSIRPGYLLWIANVSPSTSPNFHITVIRKQTSQRVFSVSHFKHESLRIFDPVI
jgi:hypothetical protein